MARQENERKSADSDSPAGDSDERHGDARDAKGSSQTAGRLTTGSISGHLVKQTGPILIGVASIMGTGLFDAFLLGQWSADALTAISFIYPITVALGSLGIGLTVGINSVVSRLLGAGGTRRARDRGTQGLVLALSLGLTVALALVLLRVPLFEQLHVPSHLMPAIDEYLLPYALSYPVLLVAMAANGVLRAQGLAVQSMVVLSSVAVTNLILDPIFIFGLGPMPAMGVAGAAWATALAHVSAGALALMLVSRSTLRWRLGALGADLIRGAADIGRIGALAAVSNAINPVGLAVLTGVVAAVGEDAVAGFGAAGRIHSFAAVPMLALSSSIGGIIGQNWGAGKRDRARRALWLGGGFCLAYGLVIAGSLVLFRADIAGVFVDDEAVQREMIAFFLVATWGIAAYGLLIVANGALNAIGDASVAFGVSVARVVLLMVPAAYLGRAWLGAQGVYAAFLVANLVGGVVAVSLARWRLQRG